MTKEDLFRVYHEQTTHWMAEYNLSIIQNIDRDYCLKYSSRSE